MADDRAPLADPSSAVPRIHAGKAIQATVRPAGPAAAASSRGEPSTDVGAVSSTLDDFDGDGVPDAVDNLTATAVDLRMLVDLTAKLESSAPVAAADRLKVWQNSLAVASHDDLGADECAALAATAIAISDSFLREPDAGTLDQDVTEGAAKAADPRPAEHATAAGSSAAALNQAAQQAQDLQSSVDLQYLQLQSSMQNDNRQYTLVSNIMKTKHDTVKNTISNIR